MTRDTARDAAKVARSLRVAASILGSRVALHDALKSRATISFTTTEVWDIANQLRNNAATIEKLASVLETAMALSEDQHRTILAMATQKFHAAENKARPNGWRRFFAVKQKVP